MIRIFVLSIGGAVIFVGASIPYLMPSALGLITGLGVVIIGSAFVWIADTVSRRLLGADTAWNRAMKAEGENLIDVDGVTAEIRQKPITFLLLIFATGTIGWLGSLIHDLFGRHWLFLFELGLVLACWIFYQSDFGSSLRDNDVD